MHYIIGVVLGTCKIWECLINECLYCLWFDYCCRVKKVTKLTEKVAIGVLSGVVKVSGFFTSSVANSKVGKKFFGLLPGEVVLASLDGFSTWIFSLPLCVCVFGCVQVLFDTETHKNCHSLRSRVKNRQALHEICDYILTRVKYKQSKCASFPVMPLKWS